MSHGLLTAVLRYERQFPKDTPWQTFKKVLDANRGKGNFNARDWGWGLKEKNDEWYRLVAQNELPLSAAPSVHELKSATKGMGIGKGPDAKHIHHSVEAKRYQKNLNIPPKKWDDVPGFVMDGVEHNGPGGLTHHLYREIGDTTDANAIIAGHRLVYEERGLNDLWAVTEKWFISKGFTIPPRAP